MEHISIEALELSIISAGSLGCSGEHFEGEDINMPVDVLVRQAGGMEDDMGEGSAGKVRPHGSAEFGKRST